MLAILGWLWYRGPRELRLLVLLTGFRRPAEWNQWRRVRWCWLDPGPAPFAAR
ncbi:MAG: hypothetical protein ACKPJJ_20320 [Planctomycetaceae bacterium]